MHKQATRYEKHAQLLRAPSRTNTYMMGGETAHQPFDVQNSEQFWFEFDVFSCHGIPSLPHRLETPPVHMQQRHAKQSPINSQFIRAAWFSSHPILLGDNERAHSPFIAVSRTRISFSALSHGAVQRKHNSTHKMLTVKIDKTHFRTPNCSRLLKRKVRP